MRPWLSLAALAVVVAGLAYFLLQGPTESEEKGYAVSTLSPAAVTRVKLGRIASPAGSPAQPGEIVIEKRDAEWRIVAPFEARADSIALERMLGIVEARSIVRYPATDVSRYGLDKPSLVLAANAQTIVFGGINAATREQYVMTGEDVYVVPLQYGAAVPRNIDALLTKALFAADEKQPMRFDLPEFTVALVEGTWAVAPIASDAGPDERVAWIDAWKNASALHVNRDTRPFPSETVKVTLQDGRTITLGIAQREPDVVLVREDEGVAYQFFADAGRKLLAPPAGDRRSK